MYLKHIYIYSHKEKLYAKWPWPEQLIRRLIARIVDTVLEVTNEYILYVYQFWFQGFAALPHPYKKSREQFRLVTTRISKVTAGQVSQRCSPVQVTETQTPKNKSLWASPISSATQTLLVEPKDKSDPVRLTTASTISSTCSCPFFLYHLSHAPVDEAS